MITSATLHTCPRFLASARTRLLVALTGAPGSGKSTVTGNLADGTTLGTESSVFRLGSYAEEFLKDSPAELARTWNSRRDAHGWLPDDIVSRLIVDAIRTSRIGSAPVTLLEGLPGTPHQVDLLRIAAIVMDARLIFVHLEVSDQTSLSRVSQRMVCPSCEPNTAEPHKPAEASLEDPSACCKCRSPLQRRFTDEPAQRDRRLTQFRRRWATVSQQMDIRGVDAYLLSGEKDASHTTANIATIIDAELKTITRADAEAKA